jgi:hypothetical protein
MHLSASRNTQRSKQSIPTISTLRAKNSFNQRQHTRAMKQIKLRSLLLKHRRKSEFLDCASAVVVGRVQRNMRWELIFLRRFFDGEESFRGYLLVWGRRSQSKIDLEERSLGFWFCHCEVVMWLRRCLGDGMKSRFRVVDPPKSRIRLRCQSNGQDRTSRTRRTFPYELRFEILDSMILYSRINLYALIYALCNSILFIVDSSNVPKS